MESQGKAAGGVARAQKLTPEQRKEISSNAIAARWEKQKKLAVLPRVILQRHDIKIADISIPCAIVQRSDDDDAVRVLTENGITNALLGGRSGASKRLKKVANEAGAPLPLFLAPGQLKPFIIKHLEGGLLSPIEYADGDRIVVGYDARILPIVCEIWLSAREAGALQKQQLDKAQDAEKLMRGLAHVGIIALVDEATGYQSVRSRDALAKILEAFVAKELQPYVRTFDPEYYEYMFKLRGLKYPLDVDNPRPQSRPQYFGKLTNDVVYRRLAPGVLDALKDEAKKSDKKGKLFQHLTAGVGRQGLLKHLGGLIMLMKDSKDWKEFMTRLDRNAPRFGATLPLDLDVDDR